MSPVGDGLFGALAILAACAFPTQVWRWIGVAVGARIDPDGEMLHWVRAVATAIIAAFVAKTLLMPSGGLADVPLWLRLGATALALAAYALSGRAIVVGVGVGVGALVAINYALS